MAHPTSGFYERNGLEYVSQSTVVGETDPIFNPQKLEALKMWRQKCELDGVDHEAIYIDSCERGTILHHKIESKLGIATEPPKAITPERKKHLMIAEYVQELKPFATMLADVTKLTGPDSIQVEKEKFSDDFGFACTSDMNLRIGFTKKGWDYLPIDFSEEAPYTVLDWKNVRPPDPEKIAKGIKPKAKSRSEHSDNFLQLGANALAHNEMVKRGEINEPYVTQGVICALYSWRAPRFHILNLEQLTEQVLLFVERLEYYQGIYGRFPRPVMAG